MLGNQSSLNPPNDAVKETLREPDRAVDAVHAVPSDRHDGGASSACSPTASGWVEPGEEQADDLGNNQQHVEAPHVDLVPTEPARPSSRGTYRVKDTDDIVIKATRKRTSRTRTPPASAPDAA